MKLIHWIILIQLRRLKGAEVDSLDGIDTVGETEGG